jgi:mannose-6-phosphate isomerase-like protein (cupin superfamily)
MAFALMLVLLASPGMSLEPLAKRIAHTDPSKYSREPHVHGGAGEMFFEELFNASAFETNLLFLHRGVLPPKSGIGHHYHNQMEEMFVILDNEAQFTIDGRTSSLTGPAGAPCRMGRSHGIYNPTERPTQWMNIAVSSVKGNTITSIWMTISRRGPRCQTGLHPFSSGSDTAASGPSHAWR